MVLARYASHGYSLAANVSGRCPEYGTPVKRKDEAV